MQTIITYSLVILLTLTSWKLSADFALRARRIRHPEYKRNAADAIRSGRQ